MVIFFLFLTYIANLTWPTKQPSPAGGKGRQAPSPAGQGTPLIALPGARDGRLLALRGKGRRGVRFGES